MKNVGKLINGLFIFLAILLLIRVFGCQTHQIGTYEMASTIQPDKRLLVSKIGPGARFPNTLGWPGAEKAWFDNLRLPTFRLPALRKIRYNDVIAFNDPRLVDKAIDRKPLLISRLVGMPGDTVIVLDKNLYINLKEVKPPEKVRREYRVITEGEPIPAEFIRENNLEDPKYIADIGIWDVFADTLTYQKLAELPGIKNVRPLLQLPSASSLDYWPFSNFYRWNRDQYGALVVPYKGYTVDIEINTIDQFREIIENHEGNNVYVDFRGVKINGLSVDTYTFEQDYYFVMDDNRDHPNDSRILGYIPKNHIIGRVKGY